MCHAKCPCSFYKRKASDASKTADSAARNAGGNAHSDAGSDAAESAEMMVR